MEIYNCLIKSKAVITIIDFSPLWQTMKEKDITQYQLLKQGIDNKTLDSLKKNKNITLITLEKLCTILDCDDLNKIVKFH
jgi:DNA-binding Xre family transcriptional regulator